MRGVVLWCAWVGFYACARTLERSYRGVSWLLLVVVVVVVHHTRSEIGVIKDAPATPT